MKINTISFFILMFFANPIIAQNFSNLTYEQLDSVINQFYTQNNYAKVEEGLKIRMDKIKAEYGVMDSISVSYVFDLVYFYAGMGRIKEGEVLALEVLENFKNKYGDKHPEYAYQLNSVASFYSRMGDWAKAETMIHSALKIMEKNIGKNNYKYASCLSNLASICQDAGRYDEAVKYFLEVEKIEAKVLGKNDVNYATVINNLATLYLTLGQFEKAEPLYLHAEKIWKNDKKTEKEYADVLNNLAVMYYYMGRLEEAEPYYLASMEIDRKTLGTEHPQYAIGLNNLAQLYEHLGRYEEAEPLFLQSKAIRKKVWGENHPSYATILASLGGFYQRKNRYKEAEEHYLEAVEIQKNTKGKQHIDYASSLIVLGNLYVYMEQYAKAEKLYLECKNIREKVLGKEHSDYALSLANLGWLNFSSKRFDLAKKYYFQAAAIQKKQWKLDPFAYITTMQFLSDLYLENHQLDSALLYSLESIAANTTDLENSFLEFKNNPKSWAKLGDKSFKILYKDAVTQSLKQVLSILRKKYQETKQIADLNLCYETSKIAMQFSENLRNDFSASGNKLRVLKEHVKFAESGIYAAFRLENQAFYSEAFHFAEQNKSVILGDVLKGQRARTLGDLPDSLALKEQNFQKQMDNLQKQYLEAKNADEKSAMVKAINDLNVKIDAFLRSLKDKYPKYHHLKYENITATAGDIQKLLNEKTLLIEYFVADSAVYQFVVSKKTLELHALPIQHQLLTEQIEILRKALCDYKYFIEHKDNAFNSYTESAHWFYKNLLQQSLKGKTIENLIIITDGELGHLPFETFLVESPSQQLVDYKSLHYLVNDYNISYNYSATLFAENQSNLEKTKDENNHQILACAATYNSKLNPSLRPAHLNELRSSLEPLPAAEEEVLALQKAFGGTFWIKEATNEKTFKEEAEKYGIIHLAMHGILDQRYPILSSLAFTENNDSIEDNFLQAFEIAHLNLNADLVVLSACETGFGKFEQGEGVISLARSFMYAGVPSLVVSLWQVNDHATAIIMTSFYQNLFDGMPKDEALRQAKLEYIKRANGIAAHPAFWSAFVQLGDNTSIKIASNKGYWSWILGGVAVVLLGGGILWRKRAL